MLNEEKKAIEDLKRLKKGIAYLNLISLERDDVDIKAIDIVLNLIKKQQREIEELIKINTPMSWEMKDKDGNVVISLKKPDNYISKDKIREAIKNREIELYADNPEDNFIPFDEVIDTLKELLEEK
jgi:hypothetical protein